MGWILHVLICSSLQLNLLLLLSLIQPSQTSRRNGFIYPGHHELGYRLDSRGESNISIVTVTRLQSRACRIRSIIVGRTTDSGV